MASTGDLSDGICNIRDWGYDAAAIVTIPPTILTSRRIRLALTHGGVFAVQAP